MAINTEDLNLRKRIWDKAKEVEGYNKDLVRKDACGAWIIYDHYGNQESPFGWQFDHIYPQSKLEEKGIFEELIDAEFNLRPFNCANNLSKSDDYPDYKAAITSNDEMNLECNEIYTVNENVQKMLAEQYKFNTHE